MPPKIDGKNWNRVQLRPNTGIQLAFLSRYTGEVVISLNGALFNSSTIKGGEALRYPQVEGTTIPISAFNSINETAKLDFEFIPSDDAPHHAERLVSSLVLEYASGGNKSEGFSELELLSELVGEPRQPSWIMTHMGMIHQGVRARTIHLGKWLDDFSPQRGIDPSATSFFELIGQHAKEQRSIAIEQMNKLRRS